MTYAIAFAAVVLVLSYSTQASLVPFLSDASYERDEPANPPWFVHNNSQPSNLYRNGVWQSQETGTNDLALTGLQGSGVKVGVVDFASHADRVVACVQTVSPNSVISLVLVQRSYPDQLAAGISNCVATGCKVIVVTDGFGSSVDSLSNACRYAERLGVIICCAVPNVEQDLDGVSVDYPTSWRMSNVLPVSATDRNGRHYSPSASSSLCVGAPGRNIVAAGTYSSGTSYACPIAAGVVALTWAHFPSHGYADILRVIRATAQDSVRRINPAGAFRYRFESKFLEGKGNDVTNYE